MIPKNLKVGDTFVDEFTFEVTKVNEDGTYVAKRVDMDKAFPTKEPKTKKIEPAKEETPKAEPEETYTKTQVNRLNNAELEKLCKKLGIETGTGTEMKRSIISKLGL